MTTKRGFLELQLNNLFGAYGPLTGGSVPVRKRRFSEYIGIATSIAIATPLVGSSDPLPG